jgi:drug/metabolite transporter (DMT)-like permease
LDGWHIACGRSLFAFFFVCALVRPWRAPRLFPGPKVALLSLVYAVMLVSFILANTMTKSANAIFLQDTALVWMLLFAPLILKEPFRPRDLAVFLLCAIGMALLFAGQLAPGQKEGNLLALFSGLAYAVVLLSLRWGRERRGLTPISGSLEIGCLSPPPPTDAELILVWGNLACVLACTPFLHPLPMSAAGPLKVLLAVTVVAFMGIIQLGLGYYLISKGMRHIPAVEASLLTLVEPVLNPIWAFIAVGEAPGPWAVLGGVIILGSLAFQAAGDYRPAAEKAEA